MRKMVKIQLLYGISLYMEYFSIFRGHPEIDFEVVYDDRLIRSLRREYDDRYSQRMKVLLTDMANSLDNVRITDNKEGTISSPFLVDILPHDLANYLKTKPNSLKPAFDPIEQKNKDPYIVMNTKCITVQDFGLKERWTALKDPLFNLFNKYNTKIKIVGEKQPSDCTEYKIHGTFSIYNDIINGGLLNLEDETLSDTVALYSLESISRNINILRRSMFNVHIGEGGGYVLYTHCNNLLAFTNKKIPMLDFINNPNFHYKTFDQAGFLRLIEEKLIDVKNNITQG